MRARGSWKVPARGYIRTRERDERGGAFFERVRDGLRNFDLQVKVSRTLTELFSQGTWGRVLDVCFNISVGGGVGVRTRNTRNGLHARKG